MRKIAFVTAAVLTVSAAAVGVWIATRDDGDEQTQPPPDRGVSSHGAEMDDALASVVAMYRAPEGATPCETAHNAFAAEAEAARSLGRDSYFSFVADRASFLSGCQALSPEAQRCLAPYYQARHRESCAVELPPEEALTHLFKVRDEQQDDALAEEPLLPEE